MEIILSAVMKLVYQEETDAVWLLCGIFSKGEVTKKRVGGNEMEIQLHKLETGYVTGPMCFTVCSSCLCFPLIKMNTHTSVLSNTCWGSRRRRGESSYPGFDYC